MVVVGLVIVLVVFVALTLLSDPLSLSLVPPFLLVVRLPLTDATAWRHIPRGGPLYAAIDSRRFYCIEETCGG